LMEAVLGEVFEGEEEKNEGELISDC
jgi:hypothetical protein